MYFWNNNFWNNFWEKGRHDQMPGTVRQEEFLVFVQKMLYFFKKK